MLRQTLLAATLIAVLAGTAWADGRMFLHLGIEPGVLTIHDGRKTDGSAMPAPRSGPAIRWELYAADGSLVEAGVLEDPRWFFWDNVGPDGRFHGGYMQGPSGLLGLNLPAVAGSIRVFEMDGAEIGRTDFEPICWTEDAPACRGR